MVKTALLVNTYGNREHVIRTAYRKGEDDNKQGFSRSADRYGAMEGSAWAEWYYYGYDGIVSVEAVISGKIGIGHELTITPQVDTV